MSVFNCHDAMTGFHADEVTLPQPEQTDMRKRRDAGRSRLKKGLIDDSKSQPDTIATQGSYAMRTMVQDPELDYDIDDGVYFSSNALEKSLGSNPTPLAARRMVRDALKKDERLKHEAEVRNNCVRQLYPEGYHIDIPVYRVTGDDGSEHFDLASGDQWTASDARAVTSWFNDIVGELNAGEPDGSQLRRVVRLTKKYGRSRKDWKKKVTSGICITKLVVDNFVAAQERDDEALLSTWKRIRAQLTQSLAVAHPVNPSTLSKGHNDPEVAFLRDKLAEALITLIVLEDSACTMEQANKAWDTVFDTSYFSDRSKGPGTGGKGGPPLVKTSDRVPRRDDGDRRFG
jgi:hypothetical protein